MADGRRKNRILKMYEIQILHFFIWLQVNGHDWIIIKQKELLDYERYLEETLTATGRVRSEYTTRMYMRTVILFYRWAYKENYIADLPFDGEMFLCCRRRWDTQVFSRFQNEKFIGSLFLATMTALRLRRSPR